MAVSPPADGSAANQRARLAEVRQIERTEGLPAAERALVENLRQGPQTPQAFLALARVLTKQRKFDDALRAAAKARGLAPLEADPLIATGLINIRKRDTASAAEAFAAAIRLDPNSARAHLGAAAVKMTDESYEDALALCEKVLDLDPGIERARELIARIQMRQGRPDLAIEELKGIVVANPENRRVLRAYVRLMQREDRSDEALDFLRADAAAHPDDTFRARRLALVGAMAGKTDYADAEYARMEAEGRATTANKLRYITALIRGGEFDRARKIMGELGDQAVLRPVVAKLEGDIALKSDDPEAAITHYREACRLGRLDPLPEAEAARAATPQEGARLWRAHTRKALATEIRSRRAEKGRD